MPRETFTPINQHDLMVAEPPITIKTVQRIDQVNTAPNVYSYKLMRMI